MYFSLIDTLFLFRFSKENAHTEFIDHHLKALFDDLQTKAADTYKIIQELGIDNGTVC